MAGWPEQTERAKIIIVIALLVIFVSVGYFRFFHGRIGLAKKSASTAASPLAIIVPVPDVKNASPVPPPTGQVPEPPRARLRNLFAPPRGPAAANGPAPRVVPKPLKPLPSLKLTGTIIGGGGSIAIINGRFLKIGDRIEGFQVVSITRTHVSLADEGRMIMLDVLENMEKGNRGGVKY